MAQAVRLDQRVLFEIEDDAEVADAVGELRDPVLVAVLDRLRGSRRLRARANRCSARRSCSAERRSASARYFSTVEASVRRRLVPHPEAVGAGTRRVGDRVQRLCPGGVAVRVLAECSARGRLRAEDVPVDELQRIAVGRDLQVPERVLRVLDAQRIVLKQVDGRLAGRAQRLRMGAIEVGARECASGR